MKIKKIIIDNYKSIKHLEIIPELGLNAFIGENSVGKSNIFDAITWLLGPVYPSFNSTMNQDHWKGIKNNKIKIRIYYYGNDYLELSEEWFDYKGEPKSGLNLSSRYINNDDREKYCSAYLGIDREIQDYLPSNKWSLIGRILQQINQCFEKEEINISKNGQNVLKKDYLKSKLQNIRDEILFSVGRKNNNKNGLMDRFIKILQEESAKQLNREESSFSIDLSLYDPWNFYRTLQLLVKENDMDMEFQASSLGMGIQASITIAVLKAYADLNLPSKTPIFIDEPELFLHPQAQRNFYNILRDMTIDKRDGMGKIIQEGLQIFYTTHSPNFIRTDKFNEIFIVRKTNDKGTFINKANVDEFIVDLKNRKNINSDKEEMFLHFKNSYENTGDSQKANEAFFAKKIILVEGQSESLILPYFFDLIKFDYIKEGISIVRCGCKSEIDRFFRLYNESGIPCYIIFDGDKHHKGTKEEIKTIEKNKEILNLFDIIDQEWPDGKVNERFFGFEKEFEDSLNLSISKDIKGLELFIKVKEKIQNEKQLPVWVSQIINKIENLNSPLSSVLMLDDTNNIIDEEMPF